MLFYFNVNIFTPKRDINIHCNFNIHFEFNIDVELTMKITLDIIRFMHHFVTKIN